VDGTAVLTLLTIAAGAALSGLAGLMMANRRAGGRTGDGVAAADFMPRHGAHGRTLCSAGRLAVIRRVRGNRTAEADQNGRQYNVSH
jgi:hypothetical protein